MPWLEFWAFQVFWFSQYVGPVFCEFQLTSFAKSAFQYAYFKILKFLSNKLTDNQQDYFLQVTEELFLARLESMNERVLGDLGNLLAVLW